jgi:hypothetical protein
LNFFFWKSFSITFDSKIVVRDSQSFWKVQKKINSTLFYILAVKKKFAARRIGIEKDQLCISTGILLCLRLVGYFNALAMIFGEKTMELAHETAR